MTSAGLKQQNRLQDETHVCKSAQDALVVWQLDICSCRLRCRARAIVACEYSILFHFRQHLLCLTPQLHFFPCSIRQISFLGLNGIQQSFMDELNILSFGKQDTYFDDSQANYYLVQCTKHGIQCMLCMQLMSTQCLSFWS